jgi:Restriction endonuclease
VSSEAESFVLLQQHSQDAHFKRGLARFITPTAIDVAAMVRFIKTHRGFTSYGRVFRLFAEGQVKEADAAADAVIDDAEGQDETALLILSYLVMLSSATDDAGLIRFENLPGRGKDSFATLFDLRVELAPYRDAVHHAVALEVAANCASGTMHRFRLGEEAESRIGDLLLKSESEQRAALSYLEQLHRCGVSAYNCEYPLLLRLTQSAIASDIKSRCAARVRWIERHNPSATLPVLLRNARRFIDGGVAPIKALRSVWRLIRLSDDDRATLAVAVAEALPAARSDLRAVLLGEAARYSSGNLKLLAWIAMSIGDSTNAANALFDYAYAADTNEWDWGERYHAIQAACRLLFAYDRLTLVDVLQQQIPRFAAAPAGSALAADLQDWADAARGFDPYIKRRLERHKNIPSSGGGSARSRNRDAANLLLLKSAGAQFGRHIGSARRMFAIAHSGNDAPWIHGGNALFEAADLSVRATSSADRVRVRQLFQRAATLLHSPYPTALALVYRALTVNTRDPQAVRELRVAMDLIQPDTPELSELRHRIASSQWSLLQNISRQSNPSTSLFRRLWLNIVQIAPLLYEVIDEDHRIEQHFSPTRGIRTFSYNADVQTWRSFQNPHERGRWLEEIVVQLIADTPGLEVHDVRHKNTYEEIDVIVGLIKVSPLLAHWGPLMLVECKNWNEKVGADPVRSFYTKLITKRGATRLGVILSPSGFTRPVTDLVRSFHDALVITFGPAEFSRLLRGQVTFKQLLEEAVPNALFA